jgi:hypothetical protein
LYVKSLLRLVEEHPPGLLMAELGMAAGQRPLAKRLKRMLQRHYDPDSKVGVLPLLGLVAGVALGAALSTEARPLTILPEASPLLQASAGGEQLPIMKDLSELNLTVTGAERKDFKNLRELFGADAMDELDVPEEEAEVFAVPENHIVVVVTLEGVAYDRVLLVFSDAEFSAVYFDEKPLHSLVKPGHRVASARAIGLGGGWGMSGPGPGTHKAVLPSGPITISLAFVLPAQVKQFSVRYPKLAGDAAVTF